MTPISLFYWPINYITSDVLITYYLHELLDEPDVLLHAGRERCEFLLADATVGGHDAADLHESPVELVAEDVAAGCEVQGGDFVIQVEHLVLAERVSVLSVALVAREPGHVPEVGHLRVARDCAAVCEELLDFAGRALVCVDREEERGDKAWRVGLNALADEQLVDLDVALGGCVAAGNGCHVLTCLVRLVLDVALHFGVAAVLLEPRVIADNVDCLCVGESEDAGKLHC